MWCISKFLIILLVSSVGLKSIVQVFGVKNKLISLNKLHMTKASRQLTFNKTGRPKHFNGIKGGDLAIRGQFTYAVSLQYDEEEKCGGGILKDQFVITAAHCVIDPQNGEFLSEQPTVLMNVIDLYDDNMSQDRIKVEKVYILKEFDYEMIQDNSTGREIADIAVLKLARSTNKSIHTFSMKLKLPNANASYVGVSAIIVGYGWDTVEIHTDKITNHTYEVGQSSGRLRYAVAKVISNRKCNRLMRSIYDSNICAQVKQRRKSYGEGACLGDSGGPLVYNGILIGVLSTSPIGCEEGKGAGVYTRVSAYLDFLEAAMKNNVSEIMLVKDYSESEDKYV